MTWGVGCPRVCGVLGCGMYWGMGSPRVWDVLGCGVSWVWDGRGIGSHAGCFNDSCTPNTSCHSILEK